MVAVNPMSLADELATSPLFGGLSPAQRELLLCGTGPVELAAKQRLFGQGDPADRFYWVRSGMVKLSRLSPAGEEKVLELIAPGQTFGEAIMFMGSEGARYPVNAEAVEATEVIGFDNAAFLRVLRDSPETSLRLLAAMSKRLHSLVNEIDQITLQSATARLVDYLLAHTCEDGETLQLPAAKHVFASRISVKPETLSRLFSRLSEAGLITVRGAEIVVHDRIGLRNWG